MIKKGLIAVGSLITGFALTVGLVLAQTTSPSPATSPTVTPRPTSAATASPAASPVIPSAAPATGMGGYQI